MKSQTKLFLALALCATVVLSTAGCESAPKGAIPVSDFDVTSYLGKWYEIARLDFSHEKNMSNVTAEYTLNDDGTIRVKNRGYDYVEGEWKESIGKAKFAGDTDVGALKVSFFGPFYTGYNIIALDPFYQTALIVGKNTDYMWILSRTASIPEDTLTVYLALASDLGFDIDKLVWVEQGPYDATVYDAE